MCDRCPKKEALEMAEIALHKIPDFQTRKRDMVEDVVGWIEENEHVTEKQLELLAKFAERPVPEYSAPKKRDDGGATGREPAGEKHARTGNLLAGGRDGRFRILMSCALVDHKNGNVQSAERQVRRIVDENKVQVVPSNALDWTEIKAIKGGWDAAYGWAADSFDAIVLVEMGNGLLGRGQYQLGEEFALRGKRVTVLRERDGKDALLACRVVVADQSDWKAGYGRALLDDVKAKQIEDPDPHRNVDVEGDLGDDVEIG